MMASIAPLSLDLREQLYEMSSGRVFKVLASEKYSAKEPLIATIQERIKDFQGVAFHFWKYDDRLSLRYLTWMGLDFTEVTGKQLRTLVEDNPSLEYLGIKCDPALAGKDLEVIARLTQLRALQLLNCHIQDRWLSSLRALPQIEQLSFYGCRTISDDDMPHIAAHRGLLSLDLTLCANLTDKALPPLSTLSELRELSLERCNQLTDEGFPHLGKLRELRHLNLRQCQITNRGAAFLEKLSKLESLNIDFCYHLGGTVLEPLSERKVRIKHNLHDLGIG